MRQINAMGRPTALQQENGLLRRALDAASEDRYAKDAVVRQLADALRIARKALDTAKISRDDLSQVDAALASLPYSQGGSV